MINLNYSKWIVLVSGLLLMRISAASLLVPNILYKPMAHGSGMLLVKMVLEHEGKQKEIGSLTVMPIKVFVVFKKSAQFFDKSIIYKIFKKRFQKTKDAMSAIMARPEIREGVAFADFAVEKKYKIDKVSALYSVYVVPEYRGKGYAHYLLTSVCKELVKKYGMVGALLTPVPYELVNGQAVVLPSTVTGYQEKKNRLINLYQACGFKIGHKESMIMYLEDNFK
jgi:GNAT superfamily N-acetyltransferase